MGEEMIVQGECKGGAKKEKAFGVELGAY